jgi:hypothetical protein
MGLHGDGAPVVKLCNKWPEDLGSDHEDDSDLASKNSGSSQAISTVKPLRSRLATSLSS